MMKGFFFILLIMTCSAKSALTQEGAGEKIDRKAVVSRHDVVVTSIDTFSSLTVGNGAFAFTVDATGLQTFPEYYAGGIPLGTESDWGWHSFPNKQAYRYSETLRAYDFNGDKKGLYAVQWKSGRAKEASDYFRENPHRLQLGNLGLDMLKADGSPVMPGDLRDIRQVLNVWTGEIHSHFAVEGIPVDLVTCSDADRDVIGVSIRSPLLVQGRLRVRLRFPYPTNEFADKAVNYTHDGDHHTDFMRNAASSAMFVRRLDDASYYVTADWGASGVPVHSRTTGESTGDTVITRVTDHEYILSPAADSVFQLTVGFYPANSAAIHSRPASVHSKFPAVKASGIKGWKKFWESGGAIDLSGSTDPRAPELERRIILSEYLTRVQCAGSTPPQETGLTYNSWYGRPHMEMYWWHAAHFALWGRTSLLEKSMQWYFRAYKGAAAIAARQGYKGVRWQKMTDARGDESPSNVGSFLIWQEPHVIYLAELIYRNHPSKEILDRYKGLLFATADFMASFAHYDPATDQYDLGKGIIPAQESFNRSETFNPPYELAYWKWALQTTQRWRKRLGLTPNRNWQKVIDKLAPLSQKDGLYRAAESVEDSYSPASKYTIDHPAVLAALSTLPANQTVDTAVMHRTYDKVEGSWHWEHTWGWDFPMVAMTAVRLHQPARAIDDLFRDVVTNTWLPNGHNYQSKRLTLYLPGNGALLSAVAIMCAGYDCNTIPDPGFPKDGRWKVRWEGMKPLP